jgi:hypothetical protein
MGENEKHCQYLFIYEGKMRMFEKMYGWKVKCRGGRNFFPLWYTFFRSVSNFYKPKPISLNPNSFPISFYKFYKYRGATLMFSPCLLLLYFSSLFFSSFFYTSFIFLFLAVVNILWLFKHLWMFIIATMWIYNYLLMWINLNFKRFYIF